VLARLGVAFLGKGWPFPAERALIRASTVALSVIQSTAWPTAPPDAAGWKTAGGRARPFLKTLSGEWCWLLASTGARRRARCFSRFRRPGPSQKPKHHQEPQWHSLAPRLPWARRIDTAG